MGFTNLVSCVNAIMPGVTSSNMNRLISHAQNQLCMGFAKMLAIRDALILLGF